MIKNPAKIEISRKEDIEVNNDDQGNQHTNESIFEFVLNRKKQNIPDMIKAPQNSLSSLPTGPWMEPVGNFDIRKACEYITGNANRSSTGRCAKYVRLAIEAGGINTKGNPVSAWQYAGFLPRLGFKLITTLSTLDSQRNFTKNMARPGDIAVMAHGVHGHICMFNGNQWVSDFFQNNMWVYSGVGTCQIFRYTKI